MSEKINNSNESQTKKPNYGLRRAVAAGTLVAVGAAGYGVGKSVENFVDTNEMKPIAQEYFVVPEGGSVISEAEKTITQIAESHKVDPSALPMGELTYRGQDAAQEYRDRTGEQTIPGGTPFELTLSKNGFGHYSVDIHTTPDPHLEPKHPDSYVENTSTDN